MKNILGTETNFASLSIKDLMQARELYHYHLINKANVVGTAVGLYLIRKDEPYPEEERKLFRLRGKRRPTIGRRARSKIPKCVSILGHACLC